MAAQRLHSQPLCSLTWRELWKPSPLLSRLQISPPKPCGTLKDRFRSLYGAHRSAHIATTRVLGHSGCTIPEVLTTLSSQGRPAHFRCIHGTYSLDLAPLSALLWSKRRQQQSLRVLRFRKLYCYADTRQNLGYRGCRVSVHTAAAGAHCFCYKLYKPGGAQ